MKFYVLASVIILCLVIFRSVNRTKRIQAKNEQGFWERENRANHIRRKPLDGLDYVKIPLDTLPTEQMQENEEVAECLRILGELSTQPIVNLTGYSNTDLKLEYGPANLSALTDYDQNYTLLVSTLQKWADLLYGAGFSDDARRVLEFAVSTRTDVSRSYTMLAEIYLAQGNPAQIRELKKTAETLLSLNKKVILKHLNEFCQ